MHKEIKNNMDILEAFAIFKKDNYQGYLNVPCYEEDGSKSTSNWESVDITYYKDNARGFMRYQCIYQPAFNHYDGLDLCPFQVLSKEWSYYKVIN